ncbi:hypothetical protein SAMN05444359_12050 [Neolewinella agarilytica]|uniref:Uncharacterized protein n=2 Tax=Neolewinella agarilytica TaxID=478744 RepID=A0A1H9KDI3_9BACT|nr:hypothetical protein SAMN05444359_12050 [Neolewinella agarilytica]
MLAIFLISTLVAAFNDCRNIDRPYRAINKLIHNSISIEMANKKNLSLDKDRLVRLQDAQLDAATGGAAAAPGSNTVTIGLRAANTDDTPSGSCCAKSCNRREAEIA